MKRILCFGDSNTYGHNPKDASRLEKRWTRILPTLLGGGYEIIEEGLCARTTVFHHKPDPESRIGERMLEPIISTHKPFDLLIIMLGTNDLLLECNAGAAESARGLDKLIHIARDAYPPAKILVISPIEIDKSVKDSEIFNPLYGGERAVIMSKQFAERFESVAIKNGCDFLNAALFAKASELDGVHMDGENHTKLARAVAAKIKEIYE